MAVCDKHVQCVSPKGRYRSTEAHGVEWQHIGTEPFKNSFEMEEMKNIMKETVEKKREITGYEGA